jgi:hypothetical protein
MNKRQKEGEPRMKNKGQQRGKRKVRKVEKGGRGKKERQKPLMLKKMLGKYQNWAF